MSTARMLKFCGPAALYWNRFTVILRMKSDLQETFLNHPPPALEDAHHLLEHLLAQAEAGDWDGVSLDGARYLAALDDLTQLPTEALEREAVRKLLLEHVELARGIEARLAELEAQLGHNQKARRLNTAYNAAYQGG